MGDHMYAETHRGLGPLSLPESSRYFADVCLFGSSWIFALSLLLPLLFESLRRIYCQGELAELRNIDIQSLVLNDRTKMPKSLF